MSNLISNSGHLRSHGGHLANDSNGTDCCCPEIVPCLFCPDTPPETFTITFSGVTMAGCMVCRYGGSINTPVTLDGTFTVTFDAALSGDTACVYNTTALYVVEYSDTACADPTYTITPYTITLNIAGTIGGPPTFQVIVGADPRGDTSYLFQGIAEGTECLTSLPTVSNMYDVTSIYCTGGGDDDGIFAYGGTATISTP